MHGKPDDDNEYLLESVVDGQLVLAPIEAINTRLGKIQNSLLLCAHSHLPRMVYAGALRLASSCTTRWFCFVNRDFDECCRRLG